MARILLVDDDELVRYALGKALRKGGHEVWEAADGSEVPAVLESHLPDVLVTDLVMPDREGIATIIAVRASHPELPIIAMSGGGRSVGTELLAVAEALGARATLRKPVDERELLALIENLTGR